MVSMQPTFHQTLTFSEGTGDPRLQLYIVFKYSFFLAKWNCDSLMQSTVCMYLCTYNNTFRLLKSEYV